MKNRRPEDRRRKVEERTKTNTNKITPQDAEQTNVRECEQKLA